MNTNNIPLSEIKKMHTTLVESIRHNISLKLMHTDENHKLDVYIPLEHDAVGLSTLEMPTVVKIWQQPSEGIIYVQFEYDETKVEWDALFIDDQIQIIEELENMRD